MFDFDQQLIKRRVGIVMDGVIDIYKKLSEDRKQEAQGSRSNKREKAVKNFSKRIKETENQSTEPSLSEDSQGVSDYSGTSYNGPGNPPHETIHTNKLKRNFENHQGN